MTPLSGAASSDVVPVSGVVAFDVAPVSCAAASGVAPTSGVAASDKDSAPMAISEVAFVAAQIAPLKVCARYEHQRLDSTDKCRYGWPWCCFYGLRCGSESSRCVEETESAECSSTSPSPGSLLSCCRGHAFLCTSRRGYLAGAPYPAKWFLSSRLLETFHMTNNISK